MKGERSRKGRGEEVGKGESTRRREVKEMRDEERKIKSLNQKTGEKRKKRAEGQGSGGK